VFNSDVWRDRDDCPLPSDEMIAAVDYNAPQTYRPSCSCDFAMLRRYPIAALIILSCCSVCFPTRSLWAQDAAPPEEAKPAETAPETPPPVSIFPDPALEAAVRHEVFAKRNNQEPILAEDVRNISRVVGKKKGIKSLEGLQHCHALMLIDLEDNEIADLKPIAELKRLQSVTLAGNKIKDLTPLENLTAMQLLDLSRNEVEDLTPLKQMANMRTLYVANNQLKTLDPVAELTKIWSLDASHNQLTELGPVGKLKWLTTLQITGNQIESLAPLAELRELDMLLMENNHITDLGPLVEMCRQDIEGEKRFAPYLDIYLSENPIADKESAIEQLTSFGVDVHDQP
jgi:Leucine-rich repeat (LRR) protein